MKYNDLRHKLSINYPGNHHPAGSGRPTKAAPEKKWFMAHYRCTSCQEDDPSAPSNANAPSPCGNGRASPFHTETPNTAHAKGKTFTSRLRNPCKCQYSILTQSRRDVKCLLAGARCENKDCRLLYFPRNWPGATALLPSFPRKQGSMGSGGSTLTFSVDSRCAGMTEGGRREVTRHRAPRRAETRQACAKEGW